jgi:hypothetical protein
MGFTCKADAARILLEENVGVLSASKVPDTLCPYYLLWEAVAEAKTVFCPPQFLDKVGQIRNHQKQSELLVIDEDSTLNYLFPPTVKLLKVAVSKNKKNGENILKRIIANSENLRRYIESADKLQSEDKAIVSCLNILIRMNETTGEFWKKEMDAMWYMDKEELKKLSNRFRDQLENIIDEMPNVKDEDVNAVIKRLDNYSILEEDEGDQLLVNYIKSIIFHYSVDWQGPGNARDLLLVGDASIPRLHLDGINGYKQVLIIGHTQAELAGQLFPDTIVLEIENFKYKNNYVVISINAKSPIEERERCIRISKELATILEGNRYPFMILTGSKKEQVKVSNELGDMTHLSRDGGESDQKWLFESGYANAFYSNSVISRGIDLPEYNILVDYGCDFSIPYWTAVMHKTAEEIDQISKISGVTGDLDLQNNKELHEEMDKAKAIKASIIRDEFSNCCLRISPTPDHNPHQPKIIICKNSDLLKLNYLDDQILKTDLKNQTFSIESIVGFLKKENIAGHVTENRVIIDEINPDYRKAVQEGSLKQIILSKLVVEDIPKRASDIQQERLLNTLSEDGPQFTDDLAEKLGVSPKRVRRILANAGSRVAFKKLGRKTVWYLNGSAEATRSILAMAKSKLKDCEDARLTEICRRIDYILKPGGAMSMREMRRNGLKGDDKDIRKAINLMISNGLLTREGKGRNTKYVMISEKQHQMTWDNCGAFVA